jgi:hypothetical protein
MRAIGRACRWGIFTSLGRWGRWFFGPPAAAAITTTSWRRHEFGERSLGELLEAEFPVAVGIEAQEPLFLLVLVHGRNATELAELIEIEAAGFLRIELLKEAAMCIRPLSPLALVEHGGEFGAIFRSDLAITIGIEAPEQCFDAFGREFGKHFSGTEFLKADAATAIGIELHQASHATGRAFARMRLAHLSEFFPADFSILVFIETVEDPQWLILGEAGNPRHRFELVDGKESIAIGIVFFPHCLERRALTTWRPRLGLGVDRDRSKQTTCENAGNSDCFHGQSGFIGGAPTGGRRG